MVLRAGYAALALRLQEAATSELSSNDTVNRLRDAIADQHRGSGSWAYYLDHYGDSESGDVIYSCDSDTLRCPYSISGGDGTSAKCVIDFEAAEDVVPRTIYEPEADEDEHYAAMEESFKREKLCTALPLYERFISKKERESASSEDFAGKGKSFPILKPEDVTAAAHALGRAGSSNKGPSAIKASIIAIAKRKGWTKSLPKAWQGEQTSESARTVSHETPGLHLVESAACLEVISLREAKADYEIKLIAPGKGSTAFYPREVLQRDGPSVFKAGTHVYLNHPTLAEEAARPEGDVKNLAGVLTTSAVYHESHAKGEGLYARMKVFADHAQTVEEKAAHVGMSIRASGIAEADGKKRDGVPILKQLTSAESVDVVTRAGAGGLILTEAARGAQEGAGMTAEETTKLIEAAVKPFRVQALRESARDEAKRLLETVAWSTRAKDYVIERCLESIPEKDGALDVEKFRTLVVAEAKSAASVFAEMSGSGRVQGMGTAEPFPVALTETQRAEIAGQEALDELRAKKLHEAGVSVFTRLTGSKTVADAAMGKVA